MEGITRLPHGPRYCPDGLSRGRLPVPGPWPPRPNRCLVGGILVPVAPVPAAVVAVAVCWVTLNVAAVATPFPSRVTVTGFVSPKFWQLRLVKDMFSRLARKVSRLFPTVGTGEVPVASSVWLFCRNGVCTLTMFWQ